MVPRTVLVAATPRGAYSRVGGNFAPLYLLPPRHLVRPERGSSLKRASSGPELRASKSRGRPSPQVLGPLLLTASSATPPRRRCVRITERHRRPDDVAPPLATALRSRSVGRCRNRRPPRGRQPPARDRRSWVPGIHSSPIPPSPPGCRSAEPRPPMARPRAPTPTTPKTRETIATVHPSVFLPGPSRPTTPAATANNRKANDTPAKPVVATRKDGHAE